MAGALDLSFEGRIKPPLPRAKIAPKREQT